MRSPLHLPRPLLRDLLLRTAQLWCGVRVASSVLASLAQLSPLTIGFSASVGSLVGVALLFDVRVSREALLLSNLGVSRAQIFAVALAVSALAEGTVQIIVALAGA